MIDRRRVAVDEEKRLAEAEARGLLDGDWNWVTPQPAQVSVPRLSLRARPEEAAPQVTEVLLGEALEVLWQEGDWARVRTVHDRYLGWAKLGGWTEPQEVDVQVTALRAHAFAGPKVSQPMVAELCFGAKLARGEGEVVEEDHRRWVPVRLPSGEAAYVQEVCFAPLYTQEVTTFALRFLDTPYVWGGRSAWGLDCSGLTQLVYAANGVILPRDADQQQQFLTATDTPQAGDLAFFAGHVGLMLDDKRMLHANATHMRVTIETLGEGDYGRRLAAGLLGFGRVK